jgi:general secretion pathway protein A
VDKVSLKKNNRLFTNEALRLIVKRAQGIPRTINILCDNALVTGYGYQASVITADIVKEIIADREGRRLPRRNALVNAIGIAGLLASLYWIITLLAQQLEKII